MTTIEALRAGDAFEDEFFDGLDLSGFDFAGKDFYRCTFQRAKLDKSRWRRARLEECVFDECDLTHMVPAEVRAHGVRFRGCKLMGVEWSATSLDPQLSFEGCDLRYATFLGVNLRRTSFRACNAAESTFVDADLTEADFADVDLSGATFQGVTLAHADFTSARGAFFDPAKNRVKDARIGLESAALLATFFGMDVRGAGGAETRVASAKGRRRR